MLGLRIIAALKRYGWLVNLSMIAAGTFFVAGATNTVVAQSIRVLPTADAANGRAARAPARTTKAQGSLDRIAERNLFGAKRENLDPQPEGENVEEAPGPNMGSDYRESDLRPCTVPATVRATLVAANNPEWSMAVLYDNSSREPEVFSINDGSNEIASDATLIEIRDRAVVVRRTDHFELCSADEKEKPRGPSRAAPKPTVKRDGGDDDDSVQKTGDNEYQIDRSFIDETMNNLSQVATQARIVPSFKNGKANGFKLFSIKPGSIYQKIGMQNGDVIQKINGYTIDSPDKALEIYSKLKSARSVNIELLRRGRAMSKSYSIE